MVRQKYKSSQKPFLRRPIGLALLLFIALIIIVLLLELTNTTHLFHKKRAVSSTIPSTTSQPESSKPTPSDTTSTPGSSTSNSQTGSNTGDTPKSTGPVTGQAPLTPSGQFVSNHRPSLSNQPNAPSGEQSACNTTPGATCTITFTLGGATKTLESKTADTNGTVIWNWDVNTAGFTEGNWKVTATATLNGQSKSATDTLEVQP